MSRVTRCFACCPTFYDQPQLKRLRDIPGAFPKQNVFTDVNDGVFEHIYNECRDKPAPTLLFVDDSAAERATNVGNKGSFSRLALASPHHQLYIVGVFQRLTACSPALRDNTEGLIAFKPSQTLDVETIVKEFNPSPANPKNKEIVQNALTRCWSDPDARYCFIWRENFTAIIHYYCGSKNEVKFSVAPRSLSYPDVINTLTGRTRV